MDEASEKALRTSETNTKMIETLAQQMINLVNHYDEQHNMIISLKTRVTNLETITDHLRHKH